MRLQESLAKLRAAVKRTHIAWETTADSWQDDVRRAFAERHLAPLEAQIESTIQEITRLAETFAKAEKECQ